MSCTILRACPSAALALAVLWACSAHAQESDSLAPVVVTATRFELPISEVVSSIDLITRQDLERSQASSLAQALRGISGFEFARNGGAGNATSFFLRGHNSVNVVVLVDGIRTATDGIGSLMALDLPIAHIERIEIMRGDASALYGTAANGGVIHIITRKNKAATFSASLGNKGQQIWNAGWAKHFDAADLSIQLGQEKSERWSAMNTQQKPRANPDADSSATDSMALKLGYQIHPNHKINLSYTGNRARVDYDDDGFGFGRITDTHGLIRATRVANIHLSSDLTSRWLSDISLNQSNQDLEDYQNGLLKTAAYTFGLAKSEQTALRWNNRWNIFSNTDMLFGVDANHEKFSTDALVSGYKNQRHSLGLFAGMNHAINDWTLQWNVRRDHISNHDFLAQTREKIGRNSGLLGVAYQWSPAWKISAHISDGFRAPSTGEQAAANQRLRHESFQNREWGLTYQYGSAHFKVSYFQSAMRNLIAYTRLSLGNVQARNQGWELTAKNRWGKTEWGMVWTEQNPKNLETGLQLGRRAKRIIALNVMQPWGAWEWSASLYYQGQRRDSDFNEMRLGSYKTLDLGFSYPINASWKMHAKIENMTNRSYQLAYGYQMPQRSAVLGVHYQGR